MAHLTCQSCGATHPASALLWKCDCGGLLDVEFTPRFDLARIASRPPNMWRYREAIPIESDSNVVSFDEGFTPLVEVDFDGRPVWIKQDQLFPTGSYKDRGASVLVSKVKELGVDNVVEDSSGNAGAAIAAYCAQADIGCSIYVPESTSAGKLAQVALYGSALHRIPGSREDTSRAVLEAAAGTYYASHSWNPFFFHGTKTYAFEVCEQMVWRAPDVVILPVGNGTLLLGAFIGFTELHDAGITQQVPRIIGIQAEHCAPLYHAFHDEPGEVTEVATQDTLAEGIAIAEPIRGREILNALRETGGDIITVSENDILHSLKAMCAKGYYIEPTSAATTAGVAKYLSLTDVTETIVSVFTGHGLKATEKMIKV